MIGPQHYGLIGMVSSRELQVAFEVGVLCFTSKEVAHHLGLSMRTIEKHRQDILAKTGCRTTVELARRMALAEVG
jgi:DNA-binding NarL/FixJ family response regulator